MWFLTWAVFAVLPGPCVVFDARDLNWEERLTVEALQGLVNRKGPAVYLDQGYAWDERWIQIYEERNKLRVERMEGFSGLLARFHEDFEGLVVYDPSVDGTRYVAMTLAGLDRLLPVCPALLNGTSPALRGDVLWAGVDFRRDLVEGLDAWGQSQVKMFLIPGEGLAMRCVGHEKSPWGFSSWGPFRVDMDRHPFLEACVGQVKGEKTQWMIKLSWDRDGDGYVAGHQDDLCLPAQSQEGVLRWNIAEMADVRGVHRFALLQLHVLGTGGEVLWHSVRFTGQDGSSVQPTLPSSVSLGERYPVKEDLRGRFQGTVDAYTWALDKLMPRCHPQMAHAVNGVVDGMRVGCGPFAGFDWPVMHRAFVFNLACNEREMESYGQSQVGGDPVQARLYRRILSSLDPLAQITGYGEPEDVWCNLISQYGHYSFHFGNNWSLHHKVPVDGTALRQSFRFEVKDVDPNPDKYYVCFMTSEGDTMKGTLPFFYDSWFDPARGTVPMNWGINPLMAHLFPAMISYFYDTATEEDYFFVGCSGAGYCYPDSMPNVDEFAAFTGQMCRLADTPCIDLWGARKWDVIQRYAEGTGCLGLTINAPPAALSVLPGGVPVAFHGLAYWQHEAVGDTAFHVAFKDQTRRKEAVRWCVNEIEKIARRHDPPFIILVYADLHHYAFHSEVHGEVARLLDPSRFQPARLDQALAGVRAWSANRVVVGTDFLNQRMNCAAIVGAETEFPLVLRNGLQEKNDVKVLLRLGEDAILREIHMEPGQTRPLEGLVWKPSREESILGSLRVDSKDGSLERTFHGIAFSTPEALDRVRFVASWPASTLRHGSGHALKDPEAMWGEAWISPSPPAQANHILFGPYADVPAGRYLVAFRLAWVEETSSERTGEDVSLITLEVFAGGYDGLGKILEQRDVKGAEMEERDRWQWFTLRVDWPGPPSQMETRILWHNRATLKLDRVVLFELPE